MRKKKALITGISGQDGSYLAELLLEKDYKVMGIVRRNSVPQNQTFRINHIFNKIELEYGDLNDLSSLIRILNRFKPDEIYHLGAQSHVRISFDQPIYTTKTIVLGTLNLLEAVRAVYNDFAKVKIYNAASSECFGNEIDEDGFQRETTPMKPVSPYGCSKVYAYNICRNYRHSYDMFISNGILFNHTSIRRPTNFIIPKICEGVAKIVAGESANLALGNLNACRDFGHSYDYVKAMWLILQQNEPDDFVCSTGETHSIRDICEYCFSTNGLLYEDYVVQDLRYYRPEELNLLKGDCSKAKKILNWQHEYDFHTILDEIMNFYLK